MRTMSVFVSLLVVLTAGCSQGGGGKAPPSAQQPEEAARNALATLQKLVTAQNYRTMGFESVDEVKSAALGQPLALVQIGLDQLKAFRPGGNVNSLMQSSPETIYPVTVNGQVRSSVTVSKSASGYAPSSFGNADIVKSLSRYRQSPDAFVVRVPALNLYFLGSRVENRVMLTPIVEDNRLKLQPGVPAPAEQVIEQLVPIANAYNGLPI
ncbi:MAG TPA: hypothetical protein VG675_14865 [Bryobacteraceae bacterium]|nr:hypothetical protein [Bryobacteraceae bacterium]